MLVQDVMTRDPACCLPNMRLTDAARLMVDRDCGALPVLRDEHDRRAIGMLTDRDVVARSLAEGKDPGELTVADCMSNSCVTIGPEAAVEDCCKVMEAYQVRRVIVADDAGRLLGIVAQADLASAVSDEDLAQVVREISQPAFAQPALPASGRMSSSEA